MRTTTLPSRSSTFTCGSSKRCRNTSGRWRARRRRSASTSAGWIATPMSAATTRSLPTGSGCGTSRSFRRSTCYGSSNAGLAALKRCLACLPHVMRPLHCPSLRTIIFSSMSIWWRTGQRTRRARLRQLRAASHPPPTTTGPCLGSSLALGPQAWRTASESQERGGSWPRSSTQAVGACPSVAIGVTMMVTTREGASPGRTLCLAEDTRARSHTSRVHLRGAAAASLHASVDLGAHAVAMPLLAAPP